MSKVTSRLALYFHTVRHLRPAQVFGRLWLRVYRPGSVSRETLALRDAAGSWAEAIRRPASMTGPDRLGLLNREGEIDSAAHWNDPRLDKLWLYNLHYFDDLNATGAEQRAVWHCDLLSRWIAENPVGHGNGWEPYPLSRRIVNWVKWAVRSSEPPAEWHTSLAIQVRYLRRRLEYHLLGNHLLANAKALVFAGAYFSGAEADGWLGKGLEILARELPEQILADGGHFERSTMYHAILVEDLLDLMNLAAVYRGSLPKEALSRWRERTLHMLRWLDTMTHPDGEIAFFNDAAFGVAPNPRELLAYARRLGIPEPGGHAGNLRHLSDSGYLRLAAGPAVALLDVAPVGPDYLPGHAHADTLSFELSLFGRRVVVNGGTSQYGAGEGRVRERGTAAHSTVQIDGQDSSEVWGGFRVARRARPFDLELGEAGGELVVSCAHDGYRRLPGKPVHTRRWRLCGEGLTVEDHVDGAFREAICRFHLHPDVATEGAGERGMLVLHGDQRVRWRVTGGEAMLTADEWHPELGRTVPSRCLSLAMRGNCCTLELTWD